MTIISFNHRLPDSVHPGAIYLGYVFWVNPSGPRRRLHTRLHFTQLSLPNPPRSPLNYRNSTFIFSHGKHLQAQAKCRSGAAGPTETLLCASQGKLTCGEGSFWMQVLREEPVTKYQQTKLVPRVLVCWGFFAHLLRFFCWSFMLICEITITAISILTLSLTTYFVITDSVLARLKPGKVQNMDVSAFHKNSFVALGQIQVYI